MRWFVGVSMPKGDCTEGVAPEWIESYIVLTSLPPAGETVMFVPGTPKEIVDQVAAQARALGSPQVKTWQALWPPDRPEGFPDPPY